MALIKYQQQLNSNFPYYFAYANNPVYYTALGDNALIDPDYFYNFKLNINKQDGSNVADLIASSKIYPEINAGIGIYNAMTLLRKYIYNPYFEPDAIDYEFPQTIRNIRVDVAENIPGITNDITQEVFTPLSQSVTEVIVGRIYKITNNATFGDWSNIYDTYTGDYMDAIPSIYTNVLIGSEGDIQPITWGDVNLSISNYIAPELFNKAFIISGYDIMTPNKYRTDGTNPEDYVLNSNTSKLFSRQDNFTNKLNINERCSLRLIQGKMKYDDNNILSAMENIQITVTKANGYKYKYKFISNQSQAAWFTDTAKYLDDNEKLQILTGMMIDIPVGVWNLLNKGFDGVAYSNAYTQTAYDTGAGWVVTSIPKTAENIVEVGDSYTVETTAAGYGDADITSKKYNFAVICNSKYTPYQLAWENELGGFDYFSFKLLSETIESSERTFYEKKVESLGANPYLTNPDYNYSRNQQDKGITTIGIESNEVININTDWLSPAELLFLRDLLKSKNVYLLDENVDTENLDYAAVKISKGRWYPIILDTNSILFKSNKKGLKQLNLTVVKNTSKK